MAGQSQTINTLEAFDQCKAGHLVYIQLQFHIITAPNCILANFSVTFDLY